MSRSVPASYPNSRVLSISFFDGKIIATGAFKKADNKVVNSIASWNGYSWEAMGIGLWDDGQPDSIGYGSALVEYSGNLFASCNFNGAGGSIINDSQHKANCIAKWNGADWYPISPPPKPSGVNGTCSAIGKYKNNIYFGGLFGNAYDSSGFHACQGIAKWNDTAFSSVGQFLGDFPPYNYFSAVAFNEYNNKLIAGGVFTSINASSYGAFSGIAAWNDTTWSALGIGFNNAVTSLIVYNGILYAGGIFTATGDNLTPLNHIAKWDGTNWLPVGEGLNDTVTVLCVDSVNNKLIAGGLFTETGLGQPAKHIAAWNGTNWQEVGGGTNDAVWALYAKDSSLYVGGNFTQAGNISANCIAVWGKNPVGINEINKKEYGITVYPNPNNGVFNLKLNQFENQQIKIYNTLGECVYQHKGASFNFEIDLTDKANGVYFIQLITPDKIYITKFVKE